jgi:hypothetical protein
MKHQNPASRPQFVEPRGGFSPLKRGIIVSIANSLAHNLMIAYNYNLQMSELTRRAPFQPAIAKSH